MVVKVTELYTTPFNYILTRCGNPSTGVCLYTRLYMSAAGMDVQLIINSMHPYGE